MEGNQQKMRETMLVVRDALDTISAHEDDIEFVRAWIAQTKEAVQEALSEPPRQCDMGTAEEQMKRFDEFTSKYWPLGMFALQWAQMPYAAEEGGAE